MKQDSLQLITAFLLCMGFVITFGYLTIVIGNESITNFDTNITSFIQRLETSWLTFLLKGFTWIGSGPIVALITVIMMIFLFFVYRYRQQAVLLGIGVAGSALLNYLLKIYFRRERPEAYRIMEATGFSFPSGHTMMAFSLYTLIAYIAWRNVKTASNRFLFILFATFMIIFIAGSRVYLGVHYPSDILGGIFASAFWVTITITGYRFYEKTISRI